MSLITVIIPNFNNAQYLLASVESVLSQSHGNLEVIVVDDSSTDNSKDILSSLSDDRVRLIKHSENLGVAAARNTGIRESRGRYISTLDADDIYVNPKKLENELSIVEDHKKEEGKHVVGFSNTAFINQDNEVTRVVGDNIQPIKEGNLYREFWRRKIFIPRDYLVAKTVLVESGMYDEGLKLYEDWDLKIRLARKISFFYCGEIGTGYRRQSGLSKLPQNVHRKWMNRILEKHKAMRK